MRVRDELKMTIAAYQTLYKSSVNFGLRKQIQAEQGKAELENRITDLEKHRENLMEKVNIWKNERNIEIFCSWVNWEIKRKLLKREMLKEEQ